MVSLLDKNYFFADTHFGHINSIKLGKRHFDNIEQMYIHYLKKVNKLPKGSNLYSIGDIAFHKSWLEAVAKDIPKHIQLHLILGNHDAYCYKKKWDFLDKFASIDLYKFIKIENYEFFLCHYPMISWHKSHYGSIQVYGHHHRGLGYNPALIKAIPDLYNNFKSVNVGWDLWNYEFVSARQIVDLVKDKKNWDYIDK